MCVKIERGFIPIRNFKQIGMDRTAIVTGGYGGIGRAIIQKFLSDGFRVVAVDVKPSVKDLPGQIPGAEGKLIGVVADVSDFESCRAMAEQIIVAGFGNVDTIVNNAGITRDSLISKMDYAMWDSVLKVDLYSMFNVTKQFIQPMIDRKFGRIINISSISREGNVGQCNYAAAKAGVVGFTKALSRELAKYEITSNAISPGLVDTEILSSMPKDVLEKMIKKIPAGRLAKPKEVAGLVSFLASEEAGYINGEVININGAFFF